MATVRIWGGEEWEIHINALLSLRYAPGDYQRVPAAHGGDCGIEGFGVTDGNAYQCYAPNEPLAVKELHDRQRRKITADIKKFIANRGRLEKLLGNTKISRWLLVVPEHKSAHLVQHAVKKTKEVLDANLPYVADDFRIVVITDDEFALEKHALTSGGAIYVTLDPVDVDPKAIQSFEVVNVSGVDNLKRKIGVMLGDHEISQRQELVQFLVKAYLAGQTQLERLHRMYPEVHSQLLTVVAQAEKRIEFDSKVTPLTAAQFLAQQSDLLRERLVEAVRSSAPIAEDLVQQAIADWLMRCPLDFRHPRPSPPTELSA